MSYSTLKATGLPIIDLSGEYEDDEQISVPTLLHYLEASHAYYLDFQLPFIRRELHESINEEYHLGRLILKLYEEYAQEIGADGYSKDAAEAVKVAKSLLGMPE